jgi:hypothetical protein
MKVNLSLNTRLTDPSFVTVAFDQLMLKALQAPSFFLSRLAYTESINSNRLINLHAPSAKIGKTNKLSYLKVIQEIQHQILI